MGSISIKTTSKTQWIDITAQVQEQVSASGISDGVACIYTPHTTAGVTINEHADPAVVQDIDNKLNELAPESGRYAHTEGNSPGHIKATLVGSSQVVFVESGQLKLGTWQGIFFCEFDGPRSRQVHVKVIKS